MITDYVKCQCGAVTFYGEGGEEYSCMNWNKKVFFPGIDLRKLHRRQKQLYRHCEYCVNKRGVDLCGCGSGAKFGKCKEGHPECAFPAQTVGVRPIRPIFRFR